jgi:regulator of protease activity HflC (stomatin/prohibitin superfamily)
MPVILAVIAAIGIILGGISSMYIVDEGHVGVVTKWGKAVTQEEPNGIRFRNPISTRIIEFDVRERRLQESMAAATANQLPVTVDISYNWRMDPTRVMEVYVKYGTPEAFESVIILPRLRQAAKAGISKFQASDLIREREAATDKILTSMIEAVENYPAISTSLQLENTALPNQYLEAVMAKEKAREEAAKEQYTLDKQRLVSQQEVQTAEAQRDAKMANADGEAYRIREEAKAEAESIKVVGEAQAEAIAMQQKAIANNPLIIDYERARRWNGQMPTTLLGGDGDSPNLLLNMN